MQLHTLKRAGIIGLEHQGVMHQHPFSYSAPHNLVNPEILIGVSSCLLEKDKRLDNQHNADNAMVRLLGKHFVIRSFSSETEIGLGVARQIVQLQNQDGEIRNVNLPETLVSKVDSIKQLSIQQNDLHSRLSGYLFRASSSGYSTNDRKITNNDHAMGVDTGVNATNLKLDCPLFPVVEEHQLTNPASKDNFIQRVCVMHRWQQLAKEDTTIYPLTRFHQQHQHLYLSHDPDKAAEIEEILLLKNTIDMNELHTMYIHSVMDALRSLPSRKKHASVLQQLLIVIQPYLTREDQQEIQQSIEYYQMGKKSITIPLTLLRYHVGMHSLPEISNSAYLFPYPQERMLCQQNEVAIAI
jgi:uncharacterized protein YbgA (DUF1722 family)/uncharacterized protein YbbK (DUF523 family)